MKKITTLIALFIVTLTVQAQRLPAKIADQPDGLTIGYFDSTSDTCLPRVFIGEGLQILFSCYSKGNYERIDISQATTEISRLREIFTKDFILKLNQCCMNKNCPDTIHGYFLMVKSGNDYESQYLDIGHINEDMCGSNELNEIIELLNKINKNYR
jgi:hypothetical protein